jgi:type II secretion system protein H
VGPLSPARRAFVDPRPRGFTLIEILVVLVILALAGGLAMVTLAPDERGMTLREARRFAGALEFAAARAQSRNETLGVSADGRNIRFWRRAAADGRWLPADDDTLAARALPVPLTAAAFAYAGQRITDTTIVPLRPTGRNEPFVFLLATPAWRVVLAADPLNRVSIDGPSPTAP